MSAQRVSPKQVWALYGLTKEGAWRAIVWTHQPPRSVNPYCRTAEVLTVAIFEFEHILPRSVGGETVFENICFCCPACNRYKADRTTAIDPDTPDEVALFHPHRDAWQEHFVWNDDATELKGLTATGRATIGALKMNRRQIVRVRRLWVAMGEHPPDVE